MNLWGLEEVKNYEANAGRFMGHAQGNSQENNRDNATRFSLHVRLSNESRIRRYLVMLREESQTRQRSSG